MSFLSDLHATLRMARLTHRGATHRAEDVPRGTHKSYSRMERIELPVPKDVPVSLQAALEQRVSYLGGHDRSRLSLDECGTLFGLALGKRNPSFYRNYPSGGALYPIETYLLTTALEGSEPAIFHYEPTGHALERLWRLPPDLALKDLARSPDDLYFSSLIVFTSVWARSSAKYGDFAYTLALLEAGHMSENIVLTAGALRLHTRPMAGFDDEKITALLDLDPELEQPVHSITMY